MALSLPALATMIGMAKDATEEQIEASVRDLVALRPSIEAVTADLAAAQSSLELERTAHAATRTLLEQTKAEVPPAAPPAEAAAGKYQVGSKALMGDAGEVEISEVMPSQPCYMVKAGDRQMCAAEQMLEPITPALAARAAERQAALEVVAASASSKISPEEIKALAWQTATGAMPERVAFERVTSRPAVPAAALEALKPPVETVEDVPGQTVAYTRNRF